MTYQATLCFLTDIKPIEGTDRLSTANALGYQVIVGRESTDDTLGVVFPSDGRLSHEMLLENELYRKHPVTNAPMGGYFEVNGRVKALKLRGVRSEAFWTPINALWWTGHSTIKLVDMYYEATDAGELCSFDTLNGQKVCEKYYTPATLRAMNQGQNAGRRKKKPQDFAPEFTRHFDTAKLRQVVNFLVGTERTFVVTEKIHGTSGRTGLVKWTKRPWWKTLLQKVGIGQDEYALVSGTRRVVTLYPGAYRREEKETGFYSGSIFRALVHRSFEGKLHEGEVVYYEIAGYTDTGALIMNSHGIDKKSMKEAGIPNKEYKQYGDAMEYTYGCEPGEYKVFVYRITQDGKDLTWDAVVERCMELEMAHVPVVGIIITTEDHTIDYIMSQAELLTRGTSVLDETHIKEGICLRHEDENGPRIYKYKGFMFCLFEGIRKNSDDYVDTEEIS